MAEFAPVLPLPVAAEFKSRNALGKYHLLLAHDVAAQAASYYKVYADSQFGTIIMDNSVIELGKPVDRETLFTAVGAVHANVVVLPDVLLDKDATIEASMNALDNWHGIINGKTSGMVVPQGSNFGEWVECLEAFASLDEIGWIGIPRSVKEKLNTSRSYACGVARMICPNKKFHLLGFSDNLQDDLLAAHSCGQAAGIDSAVPIRMGMRDNLKISLGRVDHSPRGDWWDNPGDNIMLGIENTERVRFWLK